MNNQHPIFRYLQSITLAVVTIILIVISISYQVYAAAENRSIVLGEHMMRYAASHNQTTPEQIHINGANVFISSGAIDAPIEEVLDHFEESCKDKGGNWKTLWHDQLKKKRGVIEKLPLLKGIFRTETQDRGVVACLATGNQPLKLNDIKRRLEAFINSGDLSHVGDLRYVMVKKGQVLKSTFLTIWTEGPVNIRSMFPEKGDAPGIEHSQIPRPRETRRVLSSYPASGDYLTNVFISSSRTERDLANFYLQHLSQQEWTISTHQKANHSSFLIAHKDHRTLALSFSRDKSGQAIATIVMGLE